MALSLYDIETWAPGRGYDLHDIVFNGGKYHYCTNPNSDASFDTSRNFGGFYQIGSLNLPYFLWKPSYSSQATFKPKTKKIKFGDGYEQRVKTIIDNTNAEFNLIFDKKTDKEAKAILHFLRSQKGGIFYWLPYSPFAEIRMFMCPEWNLTRNFQDNNTITAKFIEKPFLSTLSLGVIVPPPDPEDPPTNPVDTFMQDLVVHWKFSERTLNQNILPSMFAPKYPITFFQMFNAVRGASGMPHSSDSPPAFEGSTFNPLIGEGNNERWYHHPWAGYTLSQPDSIFINCGDLDFTHTGWFKLSNITEQLHIETVMPRGLFTIADNKDANGVLVGTYQSGMELRGLTTIATGLTSLEFSIWDSARTKKTVSISGLLAGVWYFYSCGYNKTLGKAFVQLNGGTISYSAVLNGPPLPTDPASASFAMLYCRDNLAYLTGAGIQNYSIYKSAAPLQGFACSFSRWNRLLTQAEINIIYNNGTGKEYPFFP